MNHVPAGRINGVHAEPGSLLGPKAVTREFVVVLGNDDRGVTVGYARSEDLSDDAVRAIVDDPRTVTEAEMAMAIQAPVVARLRRLLGGGRS